MDGKDNKGAKSSLKSVSKLPFIGVCDDGITNNISISPTALGETEEERVTNFMNLISEYFQNKGQHLNINVISKQSLQETDRVPDKIVRYAECGVRFNSLSRSQQEELLSRTFHEEL